MIHNNRDSPYFLEFFKTLLNIPLVLTVVINEEKNYTGSNPPAEAQLVMKFTVLYWLRSFTFG